MTSARILKDVTDSDIQKICGSALDELEGAVKACVEPRVVSQADAYAESCGVQERDKEHSQDEISYLKSIAREPYLSVVQRSAVLGLSANRNNLIKNRLLEGQFIEAVSLNGGKATGGIVKLLMLRENGSKALNRRHRARPNNCSPEHWLYQLLAEHWLEQRGYEAVVEKELDGARADVAFRAKDGWRAIEIAVNPHNEASNVRVDLNAGFSKVFVACHDANVLKAVETNIALALSASEAQAVNSKLLSECKFVTELVGKSAKRTTIDKSNDALQ